MLASIHGAGPSASGMAGAVAPAAAGPAAIGDFRPYGGVLAAARMADPMVSAAALARIDEWTGNRAETDRLVADTTRWYLKQTNEEYGAFIAGSSNHWMDDGQDMDGDPLFRPVTDFDVYGPGANHSYDPMAAKSWVQENNDFVEQTLRYNAQQNAIERAAQQAEAAGIAAWAEAGVAGWLTGGGAMAAGGAAGGGGSTERGAGGGFVAAGADDIVVTASRVSGDGGGFRPLPMLPTERLLQEMAAVPMGDTTSSPAVAGEAEAEAVVATGLPPMPTEVRENPYDLLTIAIWEAQYDAAWQQANADGLRFDPVRDAEVRAGFRQWRAETEARNAVANAAMLDTFRTVLPPLDLALAGGAVATGRADGWDWLTVGGAVLGAGGAAIRHLGDAAELIPTIGGRYPVNAGWAGQVHPSGVRFTEQGFPDFRPFAKVEVEIPHLTGGAADIRLANEAAGFRSTPPGHTWHHVEDGMTMQLVPTTLHREVPHTGGAAVLRHKE